MSTDEPAIKNAATNIVLLDYYVGKATNFKDIFQDICEDELKDFNFNSYQIDINIQGLSGPVPPELAQSISLPVAIYNDENKKMSVQYNELERNLIITSNDLANTEHFKKLIDVILDNQANKLSALGLNFINNYDYDYENFNADYLKKIEAKFQGELLNSNTVEALNIGFSYQENEYKKTIRVIKNNTDKQFSISANYHYDKFKNTKSANRIKGFIKDQIDQYYDSFLNEFNNLASGIIAL